jgi:hypothetical protein
MQLNLPVYSYSHRSQPFSSARLLNCYPELMPPGSAYPVVLQRAPGTKDWSTAGSGPIRGMYQAEIGFSTGRLDRLYVVSGRELYSVDSAGTATLIGDIGTPNNIDFAHNQDGLVIVNEPRAYHYDGRKASGTHNGSANSAYLEDTTANWVENVFVGLEISNTTDGSKGRITANTQTTITATLTGGTDNDWDSSDAYSLNSFAEITDPDFTERGAGNVEFLENFLLFREPNSDRIFGAEIGSSTVFDSLDYVNVDSNPDFVLGTITDQRSLVAFGKKTTEFYENTGISGFPFQRNINGTVEVGLAGKNLYARCFDVVYFVADDLTVRRLDGNQPVRVSTHYIEQKLHADFTVASGEAWSYFEEGHFFFGLTFPEGTIVYDAVTGEWHERESYGLKYWRFRYMQDFAGAQLAGDYDSNEIVEIDNQTYAEAVSSPKATSTVQRMQWTYQPVYADGIRAFHDRLEVRFEAGVGLTTGQGSDPKIMMEFSDDGGRTWKQLPTRTLGKKGEYRDRAVWHNIGSSRQRVYRGTISDPVKVYIGNTVIEVRGGRL